MTLARDQGRLYRERLAVYQGIAAAAGEDGIKQRRMASVHLRHSHDEGVHQLLGRRCKASASTMSDHVARIGWLVPACGWGRKPTSHRSYGDRGGNRPRAAVSPLAGTDFGGARFRFARDSPQEGDGFEPSVPARMSRFFLRKANCGTRARAAKKGCFFMRYRWFESISLQRGVSDELASGSGRTRDKSILRWAMGGSRRGAWDHSASAPWWHGSTSRCSTSIT